MARLTKSFTTFVGGLFRGNQTPGPAAAPAVAGTAEPAASVPPAAPVPYWWEVPREPAGPITMLDDLDEDVICRQLFTALDQGTFRMIDIPANVFRCMEILNQPDFDYGQVEKLISRSPVLAANVITIANSSLYSRGTKITKLNVALPRLGCGKIKAILYFASCERQLSNHPLFSAVATAITDHSYAVAKVADYLSYRYYPDSDNAFLAGLLHDVGKLAILKELAASYSLPHDDDAVIAEESYGGILQNMHEKIGKLVAQHWGLNPQITSVIGHHHDLDVISVEEGTELDAHLAMVIHLADTIVRLLGSGRPIGNIDLPAFAEGLSLNITWDDSTADFFQEIPKVLLVQHPGGD